MNPAGFAVFCVLGFLAPVPLLVWLDRPPRTKPGGGAVEAGRSQGGVGAPPQGAPRAPGPRA